jgi:hypothetical protein
MVYCYRVLNYVHTYDSRYYFLCYMYVRVHLQYSCAFLFHIRLFLECMANIISLVALGYLYISAVQRSYICTRAQFTNAYGGAGTTTLLLLLNITPTTNNNNNNNNKIIRNLILTKSFVNIIIFTYNLT